MSPDAVDPETGSAEPVDDLQERFDAFRTLPTPPPLAVDTLPPVRTASRRWMPAAAAAVVVLALLSVALVTRGGEDDADLSTSPDPSTTSQPAPTTALGTTSTIAPTTTEATTTTGPDQSSTTVAPGPSTTRTPPVTTVTPLGGDVVEGDPTTTAPPTTFVTTTVVVDPTIPPPASVPAGPALPPDSRYAFWSAPDGTPGSGATTFRVRVRYAACASWPFLSVDGNPPVPAPTITETADAVVITFFGPYVSPHFGLQSCTSGPDDPGTQTYDVTLSAPIGNRWVYDGSTQRDPSPLLILDPNGRGA